MKQATSIALAAAGVFMAATGCFAQGVAGNRQKGHELSARLCANCHLVNSTPSAPEFTDVPRFAVIAGRPDATPERIAGRKIIPHPAMPGVSLTAAEIRDIVAHTTSLRRTNSRRAATDPTRGRNT
jgi:mono/diheme cytochrome c family protein